MKKIKLALLGIDGKMGHIIFEHFSKQGKFEVVCGIDVAENSGKKLTSGSTEIVITDDWSAIENVAPDVAICFAKGPNVVELISTCLINGIPVVNGTTGFSDDDRNKISAVSTENHVNYFFASNFSIKSVLTTDAVVQVAKYNELKNVIVREYHPESKVDAPSGTALTTVEAILQSHGIEYNRSMLKEISKPEWVSDSEETDLMIKRQVFDYCGVWIESIRGNHYVAKQVVEIRGVDSIKYIHNAPDRLAYMPGLELAIEWALSGHALSYNDGGLLRLLKKD